MSNTSLLGSYGGQAGDALAPSLRSLAASSSSTVFRNSK